jgi:hypothetical protein
MVARISEWIELSFWQVVVRVLSGARPISHGLHKVQQSAAMRPIAKIISNGWAIAAMGWILGLILGISLAGWI